MSLSALLPSVSDDVDIMLNFHGKSVTHRKVAETLDTYGRIKSSVNTDVSVTCIITPIRDLNVELRSFGWLNEENYVAIFKSSVNLDIRDEIIDGSVSYVVRNYKEIGFFSKSDYAIMAEVERNG